MSAATTKQREAETPGAAPTDGKQEASTQAETPARRFLPDGVHEDIPEIDYHHHIGGVSRSTLVEILRSPAHCRAAMEATDEEATESMLVGSVTHIACLQPELYDQLVTVAPNDDGRSKAFKDAQTAFEAEGKPGYFIKPKDHKRAQAMSRSVWRHPLAKTLLRQKPRCAEATLAWTETIDGHDIRCKARLDWLSNSEHPLIIDLKSCADGRDKAFSRSVANFHYHHQAAFYRRGLHALTGNWADYRIIAVESSPPHCCVVYELGEEAMTRAMGDIRAALLLYARCDRENRWPGYSDTLEVVEIPPWA